MSLVRRNAPPPGVPGRGLRTVAAAALSVLCLFALGYLGGLRWLSGPVDAPRAGGAPSAAPGGGPEAAAAPRDRASTAAAPVDPSGVDLPSSGRDEDQARAESAYELLLRCFLPSGAIAVDPDGRRVVPYFANLAAMALVDTQPADVKRYLEWYLAHLNRPDRWGLAGTVYDYSVEAGGRERATNGYDSADAYAATFLTLVRTYVDRTGDRAFVTGHLDDLRLIAAVIVRLQDTDGLVWATASRREKYLMDNAEDYRGLIDYAALLSAEGLVDEAGAAAAAADRVRLGVQTRLWNDKRGNYDWVIYAFRLGSRQLAEISRPSAWARWYPDTVAQVFPVVCGLLHPSDPQAATLYENLNAWHPGWVAQAKTDPHPWSVLGYAAAVMGDTEKASAFTQATVATYLDGGGPYSALSWELAWHLLTLDLVSATR